MFLKKNKAESAALTGGTTTTITTKKAVPSIVSADLNILGNLISDGLIDIDGTIEGNVRADQVTIRGNGKVRGDIAANIVHIYGEVVGVIRASTVYLYSSCRIEGIVVHQSLSVEDGAFIDGKLKRMQDRVTLTPDALELISADEGEDNNDLSTRTLRLIS